MNKVLIISAEASSVLYAQRILEHWKQQKLDIQAFGVGSKEMEELGFIRYGKSEEMAVMGFAEVLKHYSDIKKVFLKIVDECQRQKPDVALLLDYPGFNLKLAEKLKQMGIPVVYYIAPQVWAWKQKRVFKIQKNCDKVLAIFPFETSFFSKFNVPVEFVGHPLLDEMNPDWLDPLKVKYERNRRGLQDQHLVLGLMPGSRRMELELNFPTQLAVARALMKKYDHLRIMIMVAPSFQKEDLIPYLDNFGSPYILHKDEPFKMIQLTDLVLATSGTATLMVGLLEKPMVIMYKFKWLTAVIARLLVKGTKFFGIVNLILDKEAVPERWQEGANEKPLFELLDKYVSNQEYYNSVRADLHQLHKLLGDKGATARVSKIIQGYFKK